MVWVHAARSAFSPARLRDVLLFALRFIPDEPSLVVRFAELERRSQLQNRLRRYFDEVCKEYAMAR